MDGKSTRDTYPELGREIDTTQLDRIEAKLDKLLAKKVRKPSIAVDNAEFERWWKTYPVKKAKKKALSIWNRINPPVTLLIADIANRKDNDAHWKAGYAPNPTTYLNQERWKDELTKDKTQPAKKEHISATYATYDPNAPTDEHLDEVDRFK